MIFAYPCSHDFTLLPSINESISFIQQSKGCSVIQGLVSENLLINEKLHKSIDLVNSHLLLQENRVFWFTPYIPLIAVLLGTVVAYFFTRYHWRYSEAKKKESEFVDKISTLVSEIEKFSVTYWLADYTKTDSEKEVYIKSKIRLLSRYIRLVSDHNKPLKNSLTDFQSNIYDLVTGDEFESLKRKASKTKAIKISYMCGDIDATLSSHR